MKMYNETNFKWRYVLLFVIPFFTAVMWFGMDPTSGYFSDLGFAPSTLVLFTTMITPLTFVALWYVAIKGVSDYISYSEVYRSIFESNNPIAWGLGAIALALSNIAVSIVFITAAIYFS